MLGDNQLLLLFLHKFLQQLPYLSSKGMDPYFWRVDGECFSLSICHHSNWMGDRYAKVSEMFSRSEAKHVLDDDD